MLLRSPLLRPPRLRLILVEREGGRKRWLTEASTAACGRRLRAPLVAVAAVAVSVVAPAAAAPYPRGERGRAQALAYPRGETCGVASVGTRSPPSLGFPQPLTLSRRKSAQRRRVTLVSRRLPRQSHPRGAQPECDNGRRRRDKCVASHGVGDLRSGLLVRLRR
ncbi:unnamed protein product [Urochloa humidicola]